MNKIGIDARLYSQTGVGVYLRNLLYFLEKIVKNQLLFYIYLMPEDYDRVQFRSSYFVKKKIDYKWHTPGEQIGFAKQLYSDGLDLVHFTYFGYPVVYKKKFMATIHDATPLFFKTGKASTKPAFLYELKFRAFQFVISQQVRNAAKIITPSNTVKRQLIKIYGDSVENKIKTIYEGVNYELIETDKRHSEDTDFGGGLQNRFWRPARHVKQGVAFFIYVGNFYPHKNVERLIRAFAKVKTDVKLVLIGPDDFFAKRLYRYIDITIRGRVIFYHNPLKEDLLFFYKNALALIHPSLSEGFGLPLVEAAYFGLPIIASDIAVFQEILEGKYIAFNPQDADDIAEKIKDFLKKKSTFDYTKILNKFSFERMAKHTYIFYQQLLA
ncbi:glycosyltransferase family 4 protein [Candidatus Roizmanbacteria bacterium]|nr:glycosyltransferase family 4 protein [Candidatus Roizmanbacteria bacterium]